MFTKSKNDIIFSDIEEFCRQWGEGVRVEYKRQVESIPKTVSSFANTQGGIFLIGIEADKEKNQAIFPINGMPVRQGIEEQITQSAITGIYPEVVPEVIIVGVPNSSNVVIVVRVEESLRAPHAINNSTRVYIRTGSISQPYELAEIDRIEYLLRRREDSQILTKKILQRIESRVARLYDLSKPNMTVIVRPSFPYRPIIPVTDIPNTVRGDYYRVSGGVFQGVVEGVKEQSCHYWELNEYGIVYYRQTLEKRKPAWQNQASQKEEALYLNVAQFIYSIGGAIKEVAQPFLQRCNYLGNLEISVQLHNVLDEKIAHQLPSPWQKWLRCFDSEVSAVVNVLLADLSEREGFIDVVNGLTRQLLWSFNDSFDEGERYVEEILIHNGFLQPLRQ